MTVDNVVNDGILQVAWKWRSERGNGVIKFDKCGWPSRINRIIDWCCIVSIRKHNRRVAREMFRSESYIERFNSSFKKKNQMITQRRRAKIHSSLQIKIVDLMYRIKESIWLSGWTRRRSRDWAHWRSTGVTRIYLQRVINGPTPRYRLINTCPSFKLITLYGQELGNILIIKKKGPTVTGPRLTFRCIS